MKKEDFKNQIWTTRISRVNAERRLIIKESFLQGINIYYSCITIIFSILTLREQNDKLSLMTVFMTISLLIVILYLNSLKYLEHAREYRKNYSQLHMLELELSHINDDDIQEIRKIEKKYCELLDSSSNHIPYDYYCTIYGSSIDYKKDKWKAISKLFYFNKLWRIFVKFAIIVFPFVLFALVG